MSGVKNSSLHRPAAWLALSMLLLVTLGCGLFNQVITPALPDTTAIPIRRAAMTQPDAKSKIQVTTDPLIQDIALTEQALSRPINNAEPALTSTPVHTSLDDVQIDYVYTNSIVTALYHLYGSVLDNFVDISLKNDSSQALTFVVQTEVEGYTNRVSDTVDVAAGESLEIHQNPRLLPESVDRLNSEQSGNFHIRVVSLDNGAEKLLLDETRQILLYSRRDFVWVDGFDWRDEYDLWAAWVTPTDPQVEALIRAAADYTKSGQMWSGYGGHTNDDDGGVWDRLQAIWRVQVLYAKEFTQCLPMDFFAWYSTAHFPFNNIIRTYISTKHPSHLAARKCAAAGFLHALLVLAKEVCKG